MTALMDIIGWTFKDMFSGRITNVIIRACQRLSGRMDGAMVPFAV
jgi:hypothetical protein